MKVNGQEFTIGADPEIFVAKDGVPHSAHGLVRGTKRRPMKVKNGAVQVDGMALEFNINPAKSISEFSKNIKTVMESLKEQINDFSFILQPSVVFDENHFNEQPRIATRLGCEPDYNAYTGEANPKPDTASNPTLRTAAGHVHIGWTNDIDPFDEGHFEACRHLTRVLDASLGILSFLWDDDGERRTLYGKAGAFRPKPYGMEYRVLSNAWLKDERYVCAVYSTVKLAIQQAFKLDNSLTYYNYVVKDAIDSNNLKTIKKIIYNENQFKLSRVIDYYIGKEWSFFNEKVGQKTKKVTKSDFNPVVLQNLVDLEVAADEWVANRAWIGA